MSENTCGDPNCDLCHGPNPYEVYEFGTKEFEDYLIKLDTHNKLIQERMKSSKGKDGA